MSNSTHQIAVKGVDQTAGAFNSIQNRAAASAAKLRGMLGGAMAAAGTYLGFRAAREGVAQLAHLDDLAMKTSTTLGELTSAATAMDVLGIQNMNVETLAKSFDYMAKTTGRSGMEGFYQTIEELGKIEDSAERGQAAMRIFGRSGMEFMPLINAAGESTEALQTVISAFPQLPQAAATAGGKVDDMMGFFVGELKSIWLQGLGTICGWLDNEFAEGADQASMSAANKMSYWAKVGAAKVIAAYRRVQEYLKRFGEAFGTFVGAKVGGASWGDAWKMAGESYKSAVEEYKDASAEIDALERRRTARFKREFENRDVAIKKWKESTSGAVMGLNARKAQDTAKAMTEAVTAKAAIRNELILGGSNDSLRAAMMGPQLQSESKKQTEYLKKIADNTRNIDENTDGDGAGGETFKEI